MGPLYYGQHPSAAVPTGAFPLLARVGYYLPGEPVGAKSGVSRLRGHLIYENADLRAAVKDDRDFLELLQTIIQTGILE